MKLFSKISAVMFLTACLAVPLMAGIFTDSRDGRSYKTVEIGGVVWMAENLNFPMDPGHQSWCFQNEDRYCDRYGRLYLWNAAERACPAGWRLPSDSELDRLIERTGGEEYSGKALKSTRGWKVARDDHGTLHDGNGTDDYGFSIQPSGYKGDKKDQFFGKGSYAGIWSSTENTALTVCDWFYACENEFIYWQEDRRNFAFSVRCVRDGSYREDSVTMDSPSGESIIDYNSSDLEENGDY